MRTRRAVCCDTMESGGGSGNKTTGGLAGFFGAGGAGYSHADLAGVPRKYQAYLVNISHWFLRLHQTCSMYCLFFFFFGWRSQSSVPVVGLVCLRCRSFKIERGFGAMDPRRRSVRVTWTRDVARFLLFIYDPGALSFLPHIPCAMGCVL